MCSSPAHSNELFASARYASLPVIVRPGTSMTMSSTQQSIFPTSTCEGAVLRRGTDVLWLESKTEVDPNPANAYLHPILTTRPTLLSRAYNHAQSRLGWT